MLSVRYRRERFTAGARMGRKGDKSVIPRALSRKWASFIAIIICHEEEANRIFCTVFIGGKKHRCEWRSRFIAFHCLTLLLLSECAISDVHMSVNEIQSNSTCTCMRNSLE